MRAVMIGLAATMAVSLPAHADWAQYKDDSLGIYNSFPVPPTKTVTTYKPGARLALAKEAPAAVVTAVDQGITFKVEVVDYSKNIADGSNILGEALGEVVGGKGTTFTVTDFPRWDLGKNSVYGVAVVIDKQDKDNTHILEDIVFNKGKLYLISASVPASAPGRYSSALARFIDTSQFHLAGYGYANGHDFPIGDDDPNDRDLGQGRAPRPAQNPAPAPAGGAQ